MLSSGGHEVILDSPSKKSQADDCKSAAKRFLASSVAAARSRSRRELRSLCSFWALRGARGPCRSGAGGQRDVLSRPVLWSSGATGCGVWSGLPSRDVEMDGDGDRTEGSSLERRLGGRGGSPPNFRPGTCWQTRWKQLETSVPASVFFVLDACSSDQNLRARKSIRVWVKVRAEAAAIRANRRMHDRQVLAFPRGDKAAGQSVNQVSRRVACRVGPRMDAQWRSGRRRDPTRRTFV